MTSLGELLQRLPEQSNATNTQVNTGGDGSTRVSLRGLGPERTLVLLNGRRYVPGGVGADASVDLNSIPLAAIERIEILKNGGAALYGSDAIAGVVNIITRGKYEGIEARLFSGLSSRGDGLRYDLGLAAGHGTGRGRIFFAADYATQKAVLAERREFSRYSTYYDFNERRSYSVGSTIIPEGRVGTRLVESDGSQLWRDLRARYPNAGSFMRDSETGQWRPFNGAALTDAGGDLYNYQAESYLLTPQQRAHVYATAELEFSQGARGFLETSYTHRESAQQWAPAGLSTRSEGITVSADNVYNPFGRDLSDVQRRLVEFGNQRTSQELGTFRIVTGLEGQLSEGFGPFQSFTWELAFNYGHTYGTHAVAGLLRHSRLPLALGPSYTDETGEDRCGTPEEPIQDCVPLNLFGGPGSISPRMVEYLSYQATARGFTQQQSLSAHIHGALFKLTPNASAVGLTLGYEHRREAGSYTVLRPPTEEPPDSPGDGAEPDEGRFRGNEAYVALSVPVLGTTEEPLGEQRDLLELTGAVRVVSYNTVDTGLTYQAGARVSLIRDVTARALYSTALRGPSVEELWQYSAPGDGSAGADLKAETAKSLTVGVVLEPRFFKHFTASVDSFDIQVEPLDASSSGLDFNLRYQPETSFGRVGLSLNATWLRKFDLLLDDGTLIHAKGTYDLGIFPTWKANAGLQWALGGFRASAHLRFINGFKQCEDNFCIPQWKGDPEPLSRQVTDYSALDASAAYEWETGLGTATARLGVNNLFDTQPPYIADGATANSDPTAYDFMGRSFYVRLSYQYD